MRDFARAFYLSKEWRKAREYIFTRDGGLCVRCGKLGEIVHHRRHLTPENISNPEIALGAAANTAKPAGYTGYSDSGGNVRLPSLPTLPGLPRIFRELPSEKKQFADGLIYQFAVTTVTLERLVAETNRGELIEDFVQGAQRLRRENPALKSCNATIKSFTALSKSLLDLLPEKAQKQAGEDC